MTSDEDLYAHVLKGDHHAIAFCRSLYDITQVIDDLIDRDREVSNAAIFEAFCGCLFTLPENPFYRRHEPYLRPIITSAFQDWWDSVALERTGIDHEMTLAFVLRDNMTSVLVQCARLIGGDDWMRQVSLTIRRHAHDETLAEYRNNQTAQRMQQFRRITP